MKVIKVYQKYHDAIVSLYLDELKHGMIMNMWVINHLTERLSCARYHLIVIKRDLKDDTTLWHSKFKLLSFCPFIIQLVISNQEYFWKVLFLFILSPGLFVVDLSGTWLSKRASFLPQIQRLKESSNMWGISFTFKSIHRVEKNMDFCIE